MKTQLLSIKSGEETAAGNMKLLRRMAWVCLLVQLWASIVYLFCTLLFPLSHELAVACGVLAIGVSLTPLFYAFGQRNFPLIFSCVAIYNMAPTWFLYLEAVLPGYDAYAYIPPALRMEAFFWTTVFLLFTNGAYILLWPAVSRFSITTLSPLRTINLSASFYRWATFICFFGPVFAFYLYYDSVDTLWTAVSAGRSGGGSSGGLLIQESIGTSGSLMLPVNSIWQLTPLLGIVAFTASAGKSRLMAFLCLAMGLAVSFVFFLSGSRGSMMYVAAPILFFFFYYNWERGLKFWLTATTILFVLIGVMEMQVRFRGNLLTVLADPARAAQEQGLRSVTTFDPTESHRDNNMYLFCLMVQGYPDRYPFQGFNDFYTTLVNPIPRAIWPNKPLLLGAKDLSQQVRFVYDGPLFMATTSLSYSVAGEAYQAGGVTGLFVYALFYGIFLLFFDGVTFYASKERPIAVGILGTGIYLAFWGFRAFFALIGFLYPIVIFIVFLKLIQLLKSNANHVYST